MSISFVTKVHVRSTVIKCICLSWARGLMYSNHETCCTTYKSVTKQEENYEILNVFTRVEVFGLFDKFDIFLTYKHILIMYLIFDL